MLRHLEIGATDARGRPTEMNRASESWCGSWNIPFVAVRLMRPASTRREPRRSGVKPTERICCLKNVCEVARVDRSARRDGSNGAAQRSGGRLAEPLSHQLVVTGGARHLRCTSTPCAPILRARFVSVLMYTRYESPYDANSQTRHTRV